MEIQSWQILYQLINFGIVVGALSYLLYGPIVKILQERSRKIEEGQAAAAKAETMKATASSEVKKAQQAAEKKAANIIEEAKTTKKELVKQAETEARNQAAALVDQLKADWETEKKQQIADMRKSFLEAVTATASKVVSTDLDSKKHAKLIDAELEILLKAM